MARPAKQKVKSSLEPKRAMTRSSWTETMKKALQDEDRYVRGNSVQALRRIGTVPALETLVEYLAVTRWCPITTPRSPY